LAGRQAAARYSVEEAIAYFSRSFFLTPETALDARYELLLAREEVYDLKADEENQVTDLAALAEIAAQLKDVKKQAVVALRQSNYYYKTNNFAAGIAAAQQAISWAYQVEEAGLVADSYVNWGWSLFPQGDYREAQASFEQALLLARDLEDHTRISAVLHGLGYAHRYQGNYRAALDCFQEALLIDQETSDLQGRGSILNAFGTVYSEMGDLGQAATCLQEALAARREAGDRRGESITLGVLGVIWGELGYTEREQDYYRQALLLNKSIGDKRQEGIVLGNLAISLTWERNYATAEVYFQQALALLREVGDRRVEAYSLHDIGWLRFEMGYFAEAAEYFQEALALRESLNAEHTAVEDRAGLARVALVQGETAAGMAQLEKVLEFLQENPTLGGAAYPFRVYLICYQVLSASEDGRANEILFRAHEMLQERAAKVSDPAMRRSFLENVPDHRALLAAYSRSSTFWKVELL
jgi:tetratricopeptide (TPR) repeat protein